MADNENTRAPAGGSEPVYCAAPDCDCEPGTCRRPYPPASAPLPLTPMVKRNEYLAPEPEFRMDAYYYGFDATGILAIDLILSAVACAGKSFHHTEEWRTDANGPYHARLRGDTPEEWIQNAADDAAAAIRAALSGGSPEPVSGSEGEEEGGRVE